MKFNINDYKGDYAMHCKTYEEAEDFCRYMTEHYHNKTLASEWYRQYKEQTAYNIQGYSFCDVGWYKDNGYTILEWEDFMKKEFTKADLKNGMVVKYVNGDRRMFLNNAFRNDHAYTSISAYTDTLEFGGKTVVKVYKSNALTLRDYFEDSKLTLIWERKKEEPIKEMTVAEIEKELGYKVKIKAEN